MPGELRPGPGWVARTDGRYSSSRTMCQLREDNWRYVRQRTSSARPGEHSPALLAELVQETKITPRATYLRPSHSPSFSPARSAISSSAGMKIGVGPPTTQRSGRAMSRPTTSWATSSTWPSGWHILIRPADPRPRPFQRISPVACARPLALRHLLGQPKQG